MRRRRRGEEEVIPTSFSIFSFAIDTLNSVSNIFTLQRKSNISRYILD
jgi:hypothetical protein